MRRRRAAGLLALSLLAWDGTRQVSAAPDDDWSVKRDPFDRRVVERWKAAAERDPGDDAAVRKLWGLYRSYSTTDKLIAELEAKATANPGRAKLWLLLGHLYKLRPDADKALAAYERASAAVPNDPEPLLRVAELHRQKGHAAEASAAYERALTGVRAPRERRPILRALADMALDADDVAAAQRHFEAMIALDPGDADARLDLADALPSTAVTIWRSSNTATRSSAWAPTRPVASRCWRASAPSSRRCAGTTRPSPPTTRPSSSPAATTTCAPSSPTGSSTSIASARTCAPW